MNKKKIVGISCIVLAVVIIFLIAVLRWCNIQIFNVLGTFFEGLFLALIISLPITIVLVAIGVVLLCSSKKNERKNKAGLCPNCHTQNEPNTKYCAGCGAPLSKYCSECKCENDSDAKFCKNCGKPLL